MSDPSPVAADGEPAPSGLAKGSVLTRLVDVTSRIAHGHYGEAQGLLAMSSEDTSPPEIAALAESIGLMLVRIEAREFQLEGKIEELREANARLAAGLEKIRILENLRDLLAKFVPSSVQRRVRENPSAPNLERTERDLAILFLDVASFTSLTESTTPEGINFLIERYFSGFIDDIFRNQGEICESQGDGLMLIFENKGPDPAGHVRNAAATAVAIQRKTHLTNTRLAEGEGPIRVNIGIDAGRTTLGSTKFEGLSGSRWTFTAYGMAVNIAARIGKMATQGQTLLSDHARNCLGGDPQFPTRDFGEHELKNVSERVRVWELLWE
ncbi:MAG: adenylate/guanylate cyclase domain-containing protein [Opitutales bacterium]|jgi:class 3 adenylate cyclase